MSLTMQRQVHPSILHGRSQAAAQHERKEAAFFWLPASQRSCVSHNLCHNHFALTKRCNIDAASLLLGSRTPTVNFIQGHDAEAQEGNAQEDQVCFVVCELLKAQRLEHVSGPPILQAGTLAEFARWCSRWVLCTRAVLY